MSAESTDQLTAAIDRLTDAGYPTNDIAPLVSARDNLKGWTTGGHPTTSLLIDGVTNLVALLAEHEDLCKREHHEEIAAGQRQAYIDTKIALAEAERFINRFIIHDGEAKPYSVRDGQVMLEQAEDLNRRAADLMRDACLRYNGPQDDGLHGAVDKWLDDFKGRRWP